MSRLHPIGESGVSLENVIKVLPRKSIYNHEKLINKYVETYNKVLPGSISLKDVSLFETKKPKIDYGAFYVMPSENKVLTQSVGQDSLSGILSALLSFYNISHSEEYNGGLLCIDELDASLHPDAQKRLLKLLEKESEKLNLQIIFTSHSLTIIKEMIRLSKKDSEKHSVLYFRNRSNPYPKNENDYNAIKADLFQKIHYTKPKVKVYLEDSEAKFFLENIIKLYENLPNTPSNIFSDCELIVSEISGKTLMKLPDKDDYFKESIIILDGDAKYNKPPKVRDYVLNKYNNPKGYNEINDIPKNIMFLPGKVSPEGEIFKILYGLAVNEEENEAFWNFVERLPGNYYADIFRSKMDEMIDNNSFNREQLKEWFNKYKNFFTNSDIYKYYYITLGNEKEILEFGDKFYRLLQAKLNHLQSKGF